MAAHQIIFNKVSFTYDGMDTVLFDGIDLSIDGGWTGLTGPNGAGKTTLLELATGMLRPDAGKIVFQGEAIYCNQRTDSPSELESGFFDAEDADAWRLKGVLEIEYDWLDRWDTLSHGERKRVQVGACLWRNPSLLAVDEPTNHLDLPARNLVLEALSAYRGIGLLVSHDRNLLDVLTTRTLILTENGPDMRTGSFSFAAEERRREIHEIRMRYQNEKRSLERLRKEEARRRNLAAQQHARRSKRGIPLKDHDARAKKNRARMSGKDGVGGKLLRQMDGRMRQTEERLDSLKTEKVRKTGIHIATVRSKSDSLYMNGEMVLPLGAGRVLSLPPLCIKPGSRIGITGPNGSGKSTLATHIVGSHRDDKIIYIPQEVPVPESIELRKRMLELSKRELGAVLSVVSRLGTRPEQLRDSEIPSPGETRKLMLALGLHTSPALIVMDEPTNHMDIPSIECIETALDETQCALLLVSHDLRFLDNLATEFWRIDWMPESRSSMLRPGF